MSAKEKKEHEIKREYYDLVGLEVKVVPKCGYKHEEKYRGVTYTVVALDVEHTKQTGIPTYRLNRVNDAVFYDFELVRVNNGN